MMKKVILFSLLLIIICSFFIPFSFKKTTAIKAPFLTIYKQLDNPQSWKKWVPEFRQALINDSTKISTQKDHNSFTIKYADLQLKVKPFQGSFFIEESDHGKSLNYSYAIIPEKPFASTLIVVDKSTNVLNYLLENFGPSTFSDTHIDDFKNFMETDSLYYGCKIFKTRVLYANLITARKVMPSKDKFIEAAKMLDTLQLFIKTNNIKQMQPLIAQFLSKGKDSTQVNVGMFIDREVKSTKDIAYARMPKGGPLYCAKFHGQFSKRQQVYNGIQQYFTDHVYQSFILPFETYLDNKLPTSDTSKVNIQVNFSAYF